MLVRLWQDKGLKDFFSREFDGLMTAFSTLEETLKSRPVGQELVHLKTTLVMSGWDLW